MNDGKNMSLVVIAIVAFIAILIISMGSLGWWMTRPYLTESGWGELEINSAGEKNSSVGVDSKYWVSWEIWSDGRNVMTFSSRSQSADELGDKTKHVQNWGASEFCLVLCLDYEIMQLNATGANASPYDSNCVAIFSPAHPSENVGSINPMMFYLDEYYYLEFSISPPRPPMG